MTPQQLRERIDILEEENVQLRRMLLPGRNEPYENFTPAETKVLRAIAAGMGEFVPTERIYAAAYGFRDSGDIVQVRVVINKMRAFMRLGKRKPIEIESKRHYGYRLNKRDCRRVLG